MREWLSVPDNQFATFLFAIGFALIVARAWVRFVDIRNGAPRHQRVIDYTTAGDCPDCDRLRVELIAADTLAIEQARRINALRGAP